jgi:hypothetical protein
MQVVGVPALAVDLVETVQLDPATVEVLPEHLVHPPIRPLVVTAHGGGENQYPGARVSEHL